jgi:fibronectin-binding autotransporter adhesin
MKTKATVFRLLCLTSLLSVLPAAVRPATQTYDDANGANVWDTATSNWDGSTLPWTNDNDAVFAGTGEAVTLATVSVHNMDVNSADYSFTGGTLTFTGVTPTLTAAQDVTISGLVAGTSGLVKAGAGRLVLSGANTGLSGGVTLNAGVLSADHDNALGTGALTLSGGTLRSTSGNRILANSVVVTAATSTSILDNTGTGDLILAGAMTGTGSLSINSTVSRSFWLQGDGSAFGGTVNFTNNNDGTNFRLGGTGVGGNALTNGSDWSGTTFVLSGATGNNRGIIWNGLAGTVVKLGALSGTGRIGLSGNAAVWEIGALNTDTTFSGLIEGANTGVRKVGAGTLTLSGANNYTGNTTVNAGILKLGNKNALGAFLAGRPVTQVTVAAGAAVDFNGVQDAVYGYTIAGTGVGGTGALVNTGAGIGNGTAQTSNLKLSADAAVGGPGNWALLAGGFAATSLDLNGFTLTKTGANTLSLVSATTTAGTVQVSAGGLGLGGSVGGTGVAGAATAFTLNNTAGVTLSVVRDSSVGSLAGGGAAGGSVSIATGVKLTAGALGTDTTLAAVISGAGSLEKTGAGTMTLSGANSYGGTTTVSGGTLKIGHQNALGAYQTGRPVTQVVVNAGGAVEFNGVGDATYGYTIAGTGVGGTGALVNTGLGIANNLAQTSNIKLSADATVGGTGNWALLTNGHGATTLDLNGQTLTKTGANNIFLVNSTVTAGTIQVSSGTLWLGISESAAGVNASAANVVADSGGTIRVFRPSTLGSLTLNGGTLNTAQNLATNITLNNTANTIAPDGAYRVLSGQLTGAGGFTVANGGGTPGVALSNPANNFAGNVTINTGTYLRLDAAEVLPDTATVTINTTGNLRLDIPGGGTETIAGLGGSGLIWVPTTNNAMHTLAVGAGDTTSSFAGAVGSAGQNNAFLSLVKTGSGTLTLAGDSFYAGGTTVNGGTLLLNRDAGWSGFASTAAGTGNITVNSGATVRSGTTHSIWGGHQNTRTVTLNEATADLTAGQEYFHKLQMTGGTVNAGFLRVGSAVGAGEITTLASATTALINTGVDMTFGSLTLNVADGAAASDLTMVFMIGENAGAGSGAKSLTKNGAGTLTLSGNNTYTGTTTVTAGTLNINGTHAAAAGLIQVEAGASLGGVGTTGDVSLADGATFRPGNSAGVFTVRDLYLGAGAILDYELDAPNLGANPGSDRIVAQQFLQLDGVLNITALPGFDAPARVAGDRWLLATHLPGNIDDRGLSIGTAPALPGSLAYVIDTSIDGEVYLAVVPEAGSGALVLLGLALLARRRRG